MRWFTYVLLICAACTAQEILYRDGTIRNSTVPYTYTQNLNETDYELTCLVKAAAVDSGTESMFLKTTDARYNTIELKVWRARNNTVCVEFEQWFRDISFSDYWSVEIGLNNWAFVAVSVQGTTAKFYVNSTTPAFTRPHPTGLPTSELRKLEVFPYPSTARIYLDEVTLYSDPLTDAQRSALLNPVSVKPTEMRVVQNQPQLHPFTTDLLGRRIQQVSTSILPTVASQRLTIIRRDR